MCITADPFLFNSFSEYIINNLFLSVIKLLNKQAPDVIYFSHNQKYRPLTYYADVIFFSDNKKVYNYRQGYTFLIMNTKYNVRFQLLLSYWTLGHLIYTSTNPGNAVVAVKNSNFICRQWLIALYRPWSVQLSEEETILFYWYSPSIMGTQKRPNLKLSDNSKVSENCLFILIYSFGFNVGKFVKVLSLYTIQHHCFGLLVSEKQRMMCKEKGPPTSNFTLFT